MSDLSPDYFLKPVAEVDPEIAEVLKDEAARQERTLEMIASENFVPQSVLDCQGSVLTNKYAEGYPGRRYYGGCEYVDIAEQLAIDRAKALFGADHVNVQPHSGAQANSAVYMALLDPGDRILGMKLDHGGHLSHGMKINFSGLYFDIVAYGVREEDSRLDMDELAQIAEDAKPKLIIAGWSAYPRQLDFQRFREIADSVGAILMADIAHFAGLVAAEEHPSPIPYCDVVTTTTHKTLGGGRGGMIMCREEYAKKIDSARVPGPPGRPADAHDRGQGGDLQDRPVGPVPRAPAAHARGRGHRGRGDDLGGRQRAHRTAPTCTSCWRTCASRSSTASRPRTGCTRSASRSTGTPCRSTRARRRCRRASGSARRRSPRAASRRTTSARSGA